MNKFYAFSDAIESASAPAEFLLLKKGDNTFTISGKSGKFSVTDDDINQILQEFNSRGKDIVVDYDHATLDKEASMKGDAPAGGWIQSLKAVPEGIMAVVKSWSDKAKDLISKGEYKYISPVIMFNPGNKSIMGIHSVGLTNHPAIHNATPISAYNDFDQFFDTEKANSLFEDYKHVTQTIKAEIDSMKEQLHGSLAVLHDLVKQFPHKEGDVTQFIDSLFCPDIKALNDMATDIPILSFSDISTEITQNRLNMNGTSMISWIDNKITELNERKTATNVTVEEVASIESDIAALNAERQRLLAFKAQYPELWEKGYTDGDANTAISVAAENASATPEAPEKILLPNNDTAINDTDVFAKIVDLLMEALEAYGSENQEAITNVLGQKLAAHPMGKVLIIKKEEAPAVQETGKIDKQQLPLSDLGLTISDSPDNIILRMNDIVKSKKEADEVLTKLKMVKFSDILGKFDDMENEISNQKAINAVDKMMSSPECKITESMKQWAIDFAKRDLKAFNDYMAGAPVYFTENKDMRLASAPPQRAPMKSYSDEQVKIAAQFGRSPEEVYN